MRNKTNQKNWKNAWLYKYKMLIGL